MLLLAGCSTSRTDPLEPYNRFMYSFNNKLDKVAVKPAAKVYKAVIPTPVRTGVGNFFSNLGDVVVTANDLLQLNFVRAGQDTSRFIANSTFGVLGIFDVASHWDLPKHAGDFGLTLGRWGVGPGPYLVLPFFGPSDFRDALGLYVDGAYFDPVWMDPNVPERNSAVVLRAVDERARLLGVETLIEQAAIDPYAYTRDAYLQRRQSLLPGGARRLQQEEEEDQEGGVPPSPATRAAPPDSAQ